MRTFAGAVLWGLLATGSAQAADCQLKQFTSIDITGLPDRILLPVTIGDTPKSFALELAASLNYLNEATATELGLKTRPVTSLISNVTFGSVTRVAYAPKFQFGAIKGQDVEFLMLPQSDASPGIDGSLGTRVFEKLDLELDMAHAKMNVFLPDHCPGKVVYWTKTGFAELPYKRDFAEHITVSMELDGHPVSVALQTSGQSVIGMNAMRRIFKLDENSPGMALAETRPDGVSYYHYPFKALVADGLTVGNPNILVRGEPAGEECDGHMRPRDVAAQGHVSAKATLMVACYGGSDIQLGLSVLSKLRIYMSSQEKLIYLTGAGAQ